MGQNADARDKDWEFLQQRTAKANAVREAVHLLDVCYHDLRVMLKYFDEHNATQADLKTACEAAMGLLTDKSDKYETWLNAEQAKISAAIERMNS